MLTIEYLKENGLESLKSQFSIKTTHHEDGRVILNYNQIESPKFHPIVEECRGLCLDSNFDLVARSFNRFYNIQERKDRFNYEDCLSTEKIDGSLGIVYTYDDKVCFNTRGSFGFGQVNNYPITWRELFSLAVPDWQDKFRDCPYTLVGELCSKYNRVVVPHETPRFVLLSCFDGKKELDFSQTKEIAKEYGLEIPNHTYFSSLNEVVEYVESKDGKDFEGVVLRSGDDRVKAKNSLYVSLHHTFSNSAAINPKNLVSIILKNEQAEVVSYFPEFKDEVEKVESLLNKWYQELDNLWFCFHDEKSQKKFALAVKDHPLSGILFNARKCGKSLKEVWMESENILIEEIKRERHT
jgi:RNA ligase